MSLKRILKKRPPRKRKILILRKIRWLNITSSLKATKKPQLKMIKRKLVKKL